MNTRTLRLSLLACLLASGADACTGPPPLHIELLPVGRPGDGPLELRPGESLRIRAVPLGTAARKDPLDAVAGAALPGGDERAVRLDGRTREGEPFSVRPLGPTPSMLLQWGGLDPERPGDPRRRRDFGFELHTAAPGLAAPADWQGPAWDPAGERWYAEAGRWASDAQMVRFLHRNAGARFGDEAEPWIKLETAADGTPRRLHLWLVVGAGFLDHSELELRLLPCRDLQAEWRFGSSGATTAGNLERTVTIPASAPPGPMQLSCQVRLDWQYGTWAGLAPWTWEARVRYLGYVDLSPVVTAMTSPERRELVAAIDGIRSRLRCMPDDQAAPVFARGEACSYQAAAEPDEFLDPDAGGAVPALLRQILPTRLQDRAAAMPRGGEAAVQTLRWSFSGSFPHRSADLDAPPLVADAWGRPGTLELVVKAARAP